MKIKRFITLLAAAALPVSFVSGQTSVTASANANFIDSSARDLTGGTTMTLRNAFGTANDDYGFLRFAIDHTNDTIGGISVNDISSISLNLYVTTDIASQNNLDVYTLADLANPGGGFESETSWANNNITVLNSPLGDISSGQNPSNSAFGDLFASLPSSASQYTGTTVSIAFSIVDFKAFVEASTNDEITFILAGPGNRNMDVASLSDATNPLPQLTITAVPEPSAFALLAGFSALGWVMLRRRG